MAISVKDIKEKRKGELKWACLLYSKREKLKDGIEEYEYIIRTMERYGL